MRAGGEVAAAGVSVCSCLLPAASLGWCSADCQLSWQPDLPEASPAKCHVTSGLALPKPGPQSFSHPHPPHPPSLPPLNTTWKWEPFVCFSLFITLCLSSVGWGDLPAAVAPANGIANIKQYSVITVHAASTGRSSISVELQQNVVITRANFIDVFSLLVSKFV